MKTVIEFIACLVDGGSQTVVRNYAERIDQSDISLIILTLYSYEKSAVQKAIAKMGIPVISLYPGYNFFFRAINKLFGRQITSFLLKRKIVQLQPCAIHIHSPQLKIFEPIRFSIGNNVKLFYTCHTLPKLSFSKRVLENEKAAAKTLIRDNNLKIIALHEKMSEELNHLLCINNTVVLKNGIDITKYKNIGETKNEIRKSLNIPTDIYVVGHVGRFAKEKNQVFLLDIFVKVLRHKEAHLVLVGDGVAGDFFSVIKEKIKELGIEKKVTILSHRNDVHRILKAFDIFVFPSLYEGLGMALLEAQAAGLRCVVSDSVPDVARVLDSTVTVSLNKPAEYWCDVILDESITQPYTAMLEEYDINQTVKKLQKMYIG